MKAIEHAIDNIPDDLRDQFVREVRTMQAGGPLTAVELPTRSSRCLHKPTKAEKKAAKRARRGVSA